MKSLIISLGLMLFVLQGCATAPPTRQPAPATPPVVVAPIPQPEPVSTAPVPVPQPSQPVQIQPAPSIMGAPVEAGEAVAEVQEKESPVVLSLLAQADKQSGSGELDRAAASIERGLRIEPRNAKLWSRLAQIRIEQKRPQQAEALAKKSNRFARGRQDLQAQNWRIIAQARKQKGDAKGAAEAQRKAQQYQ